MPNIILAGHGRPQVPLQATAVVASAGTCGMVRGWFGEARLANHP